MDLKNSLIALLVTLGITSAVVVGFNESCTFGDAAEIVPIGDQKVCFVHEENYVTFKQSILQTYNDSQNKGLFLYSQEGVEFMAIQNYEYSKGITHELHDVTASNIEDKTIKAVLLSN